MRSNRAHPVQWTLLALLSVLLAACTITVLPGEPARASGSASFTLTRTDVIDVFEPTRGTGSTYFVGEDIAFRVLTRRDGYLTLSAIDPDGSVYVFARNLFVEGGRSTVFAGPDRFSVFSLVPPRGLHRVRASFTPARTDTSRVTYRNVRTEANWTRTIEVELRPYPVRDVVETYFTLR